MIIYYSYLGVLITLSLRLIFFFGYFFCLEPWLYSFSEVFLLQCEVSDVSLQSMQLALGMNTLPMESHGFSRSFYCCLFPRSLLSHLPLLV